ncbi:unnamed protein product [Symbiodinium sp. CCMP2592]|nr:unnamed protein product [Symbiodinium sp. CCMP2592]
MRVALLLIGALVRPLGGLWPFAVGSENQTCDKEGAGSCPTEGHEPFSTRGSEPSPGASYWWFDWSWEGSTEPKASTPQAEDAHSRRWYFRILAGVLWEIWEGGLTWCGTLCASIGLAARWTYWLATTTILLGMLQLTCWTYAWVVRPIIVVIGALLQYVAGRGTWEAVLRGHGENPYHVRWTGPQGEHPWSVTYVQDQVRGRGEQQLPYDLLVTDGVAVARLRHGAVRGRTNRHGFLCRCDSVHGASHRYWRRCLERAQCVVHLCSVEPCTSPEAAELHITASSVVPQCVDVDLNELSGRGPMCRALNASKFMALQGVTGLWGHRARMWALDRLLVLLWRSEALEEEGRTPRHDLSETESEEEDNPCQADAIAWKEGTQTKRLSKERCKDAACSWVKLLNDDGMQSSSGELHWDGLQASCQLCARHQESYALSKTRRACSVEGCGKVAQTVKGGVKLCRLHASKEERGPTPKPGNFASRSRGPQEARKRSSSRGAERARPHSQDATPKRGTQTEAAELRGISSPPRLDGATSVAPFPGVDASVEDQVLTGLTWEEIAGIPDEDLRKRAIFLKQRGAMDRSTSRPEAPDDSQALFAYMEARLQGKGHDSAVEVSAQRRLRELARRHCLRLTSELPAEAGKFIWELAQPQASTDGQPGGGFYPWSASDPGPPSYHPSRTSPWAAPAPDRPWAAPAPDHRPTAQALFRPNPGAGAGGAGGRTDAVDALAQATRAFRAGAFTDAEAPAADETTKALQAIAKSLTSKEDALAQERGKLASIGRLEERLVFLLRGCDSLSVTLCPGVVGKELFHALRIAGTQARPQLRKIEFPCNIQNRHSYGFAALQLGGKTLNTLPEYCLSAGDFPLTSEEDFDNYGGSPDLKLERKGRYPNTLTSWFRAALRQSWAFACLFGEEYYPVLEKTASHLLRLGEQHGYAWSASAVYGAWEELWARFCEEARELDRRIRRAMQDETPTFARLKFFALSPGPDGQPWLQLPGTFRLDDDTQYFCTDMLPRMQRQLSRRRRATPEARTEPGVPPPPKGGRAGGEAADKAAPPKLLGPSLTPKEAARSLDHRPKDQQGQYLCRDFLTHRGGHEVDREFTRVRAEQAAKAAAAKQEGIAAAKAKVSATQRTNQAAGTGNADRTSRAGERVPEQTGHVVADLDNVLPTDREETLGALLKDEGSNWWHDVDAAAATLTCPSSKFEKSARADTMRVIDAAEPALGPYPPGLVGVYLRNRLLRLREETGRAPELEDVTHLLEEAVSLGGPELSEEAAHLLEERGVHRKAGESPLVQLSGLTWNSSIGAGTLTWKGVGHWAMYDYQDQLPLSSEACERMGFAAVRDEPKQCLLLHVAAAYLATPDQPLPTPEAVWALAAEWRVRWCSQARVAEDSLGPTPERLTQAEADVRVFHHDLLHFGHDRDYRTLVAHPLEEWDCLGLAVLRLDAYMRPSVEIVCGSRYSGQAEDTRWVLVHRGHMRLLVPDASCLPPLGSRELEAAGWEAYLDKAEGSPLLDAGRLLQCQVCHPKRAPGSFRTGRLGYRFCAQVAATLSRPVPGPTRTPLLPPFRPRPSTGRCSPVCPPQASPSRCWCWGLPRRTPPPIVPGDLCQTAAAAAALTYITEGGVSCLWLLPAALPPGPPADEWSSVLRLAAAQLQTGGRCVLEAPLYRRAWTDKATRIQLAGACWHAERLPSPLLGPAGGVTMLRASFCVPPGLAALCSTGGGEEDFASKMQRLKIVLDNPAGEAERKSQEADLSEGTGDSVRCGKLFADSGPLLGPPPSWLPKSLSKEAEEATEAYLRKVHQVEYSLEAWNGAVQAGTTLLRLCGGWKETVGALRYAWRARGEDHFAGLFDHHLDSHLPEDLLAWVRRVAQEGVKAEYRGTQRARVKATPHPSLKDHVEEARQLIWQDATRGRVLLMSPGPDEEDLLEGVVSVPLARVPKYNPDRSVSSKGRVIWDARVVNELCHKDDHFPAIQPRYAEVVRLVMWYKSRYPGVRVLLAKKDVSEAFKWLWVEQDDCRLFGADLPTEGATRDSRGDASRPVTVLYLAMTFGWTGAPGEFMAFAWAIKLLHRACGPDRPEWHDSSSFRSLALMDDSVVIEPDLGLRPQLSVDALEEAIRQTLGPLAINAAKDVEEGTLTTRKLIWGLEFDTEAGTCRLPPLKVERAYHVLQSPYFDAGQTKVPLKEVQVLRGSQQFWLGVLPQLAPYLQSTNALLGPADREGHVVLRGNEAEQSAQWEAFWSAIELQRLLVGSRQFWEARFVSQLEHALTTPELVALPEVKRNLVWVSADATPTRLGAIDWTARVAVACAAAPLLSPLEANAQDPTDLEARTEPEEDLVQIGVAELLALLVLVVARKEAWAGSVVLYLGDNTNVQDWLRKRQAGNAQANHLLKVLGALEGVYGLQVRGAYLRTYHKTKPPTT